MAGKRHIIHDYAEDSYTDDDDDMDMEMEIPIERDDARRKKTTERARPGRPRKMSLGTSNTSIETNATSFGVDAGMAGITNTVRRRGRGPSKRPCLNRNALMARENRQRKKEYIEKIESKLQFFQQENQELNNTIQKQSIEIKRLNNEVAYLKNVLNNNTMISTLLKCMNDSLRKMHNGNGDGSQSPPTNGALAAMATSTNGLAKSTANNTNTIVSGQTSKTNNLSVPLPGSTNKDNTEVTREDGQRLSYGQTNSMTKIARKTMPITNYRLPKTEDPPSVESILDEEDKRFIQKSSPVSSSNCEYNMDRSSAGYDNQLPTTPMSTLSNSLDKNEASLSDTDFSQLSSFNVDLFDNLDKLDDVNPLQFEPDASDLFNEDTLFHTFEKESGILSNDVIDPLEVNMMSDALNEKSLFSSLENAGVCLHINSSRVSLEYCSICHLNSLNSQTV